MRTSAVDGGASSAIRVRVLSKALVVDLRDGRSVSVPLTWYPRLLHGSSRERRNCHLIAGGTGIHWPDLDEDLSVDGLLAGRPSTESRASLRKWLAGRVQPARPSRRGHGMRRRARA